MSDKIEENMNLLIENNEVLKRDLDRQEKSEQLRRQFVSNVSHDFKTPLALIQAYSEVLEETCDYCFSIGGDNYSEGDVPYLRIIDKHLKKKNEKTLI